MPEANQAAANAPEAPPEQDPRPVVPVQMPLTVEVPKYDPATGVPDGTKHVPYVVALDAEVFKALKEALKAAGRGDVLCDYARGIRTSQVGFVRSRRS